MRELSSLHLDAVLGIVLLAYLALLKVSELRARKHAVTVTGKVLKVFAHRHCTSYFVGYTWQDVERVAEYRGPPLRRSHEPGTAVEILVDPTAPDVALPDTSHDAPNAAVGSGTCALAGAPLVTWLDLMWTCAAVAVIVRSFA